MANKRTQYLLLDYDDLTEAGLKKLIAEFAKQEQVLVDFSASNRVTRKDGQQLKKFTMFFDSGQSVTVTVNSTGDLVQVKLNSTVLPINSPKNERDFATDVSSKIERNQERFEKSLAAKAQRAINDTSKKRTATKTATQLLVEAQDAHATAQASIEQLEKEKVTLNETLLSANNQTADYRTQLEKEKAITSNLLDQLEELGVTPNV